MMVDFDYLKRLIDEVNELKKQIGFYEIDDGDCIITYMPTKKTSFVGFLQGYRDQLTRHQKGMTETDKIRSTTKDYLRFIRKADGELIQIEKYGHGRIDCLFQVHHVGSVRYLLPFSATGGFYPTYAYATKYADNRIVKEYMVSGNQIVYESYTCSAESEISYSYINYVCGSNYPIREQREGVFRLDPLSYEETYYDNWQSHR